MMMEHTLFDLEKEAVIKPFTKTIKDYCDPFSCGDPDLDEFFSLDAFYYDDEMLGKTYTWIDIMDPTKILGMVTLANDSIKAKLIGSTAKNRIQRGIINAKRGMNYPAVLIGRLGVSSLYRKKGYHIGTQIIEFLKGWFRSSDNKTGCRFMVVDAYNNEGTVSFYRKNGFKLLYKTEEEERNFLEL